jgi:O-antigen/teichoic acid export membrane protein
LLKDKAARGALWTLVEYGGGEGISFVVFLILARVVAPADFGLISLALVFVAFVQMFVVQGFADAVVQREDLEPDHCTTAFWTNVAIAVIFFAAILGCADWIAAIFHEPKLALVLRSLAVLPIGTALISIHRAVFRRRLDFSTFAKRAVIGVGAGGIVGVALALNGFGVWSLVFQQLTNAAASVVVFWWGSDWRPSWRFSPRCFREMAHFSGSVMGSNLVTFIGKKADVSLIGYFFTTEQLGYYYLVQRLLLTMGLVTQSTVQSIVMPVLSRVQNDRPRFREIFTRSVELLNAVWLPLALGLGAVASLAVPIVFGEQWLPSVPLLEIMALCGFTDAYYSNSAPALAAAGRPQAYLKLSVLQALIVVALLLPGTQFGLVGVVVAEVVVAVVIIPFHLIVLKREAGIEGLALFRRSAPSTAAAIVMAATVLLLRAPIAAALPPWGALVATVLLGVVVYAAGLAALAWRLVRQMGELLTMAVRRTRPDSVEIETPLQRFGGFSEG